MPNSSLGGGEAGAGGGRLESVDLVLWVQLHVEV